MSFFTHMEKDKVRAFLLGGLHALTIICIAPVVALTTFLVITYPDLNIPLDISALALYSEYPLLFVCLAVLPSCLGVMILRRWPRTANSITRLGWLATLIPLISLGSPWLNASATTFDLAIPFLLFVMVTFAACLMADALLLLANQLIRQPKAKQKKR